MSKKETIYAFRKSDSGYRIENVNRFINAFRQAYPCVNINRQDVEIALKDRPDVRGFRGAYQAPHPGMLAKYCQDWRERYANETVDCGIMRKVPSAKEKRFAELCYPTSFNDEYVFGYRRPNVFFSQDECSRFSTIERLDVQIQEDLKPFALPHRGVVYALHHHHQGHIHQFIRAIVTHTMNHEPRSDVAMTTWLHQTVLFKNQDGSSFEVAKKPLPTARGLGRVIGIKKEYFDLTGPGFANYLLPKPNDIRIRDHIRTVTAYSLACQLDLIDFSTAESLTELPKRSLQAVGDAALGLSTLSQCYDLDIFHPGHVSLHANRLKKALREVLGDDWADKHRDNLWESPNISAGEWSKLTKLTTQGLAQEGRPVLTTAIDFRAKVARFIIPAIGYPYPCLHDHFTQDELAICDQYWLDGFEVCVMRPRLAMVLGRSCQRLEDGLVRYAHRWTTDERGRVVDDSLERLYVNND